MVSKNGKALKAHHHVKVDNELRNDCRVWEIFLGHQTTVTRPFIDFQKTMVTSQELAFYTDSSRNHNLGFGHHFSGEWTFGQWEMGFINQVSHSLSCTHCVWEF